MQKAVAALTRQDDKEDPLHEVLAPACQSLPVVVASPHSGRRYPEDFLAQSRLDPLTLRKSEDSFVDEIVGRAPNLGAPLIRALFPRAFVDPNREPFELDPAMFEAPLPDYANTRSPRVAAGLGTIARVVANGAEIYEEKLSVAEGIERIRRYYLPYHESLLALVEETRQRFGRCLLLDCHSMPSIGGPLDRDPGSPRVDIVLGDCHGSACRPEVMEAAAREFTRKGYAVTRNTPYSGGFVTRHYGRPAKGVDALQIEINRALYMDQIRIERAPGMQRLIDDLSSLIERLGRLELPED
jgi:N-formylglutamate amidohydrolase